MVVDLVLGWVEAFLHGLVGLLPHVCPPGAGCAGGESVFIIPVNVSVALNTVMEFFNFANHWLPVDIFLVCMAAWFLALGLMAGIRLVWRLLPGLG